MTIETEREKKILRYHHVEKWPIGTIARQLGIHHSVVRRVLSQAGMPKSDLMKKPSIISPFLTFITDTLKTFPKLAASRLYDMVKNRGYKGGSDHFRHTIALHRPRPSAEAYLRLRTLPGEQAQVDWGHFGYVEIGRARRPLMAFVMVLSYSRKIFLRFYLNAQMANFLRGHVAAFEAFGGVPKVLLYDNLKSAVLERQGDAIRFNPELLEFSGHYHFEPRPVAVARGNEKGRVERAIRYIRDNFFAARDWKDIDDLNAQAMQWCNETSADRLCPEDKTRTVADVFLEEQSHLLQLPGNHYYAEERVEVSVSKTPYLRFDLNDYSVPHDFVKRTLIVHATQTHVHIHDGATLIAEHERCYDKGKQVENNNHVQALVDEKKKARHGRGQDRLIKTIPGAQIFLMKAAERGYNLGSQVSTLLRLLDMYGAKDCEIALLLSVEKDIPHVNTVRLILEKNRDEQDQKPLMPVRLPDDDRVRQLSVRPHDLSQYDQLEKNTSEKENE